MDIRDTTAKIFDITLTTHGITSPDMTTANTIVALENNANLKSKNRIKLACDMNIAHAITSQISYKSKMLESIANLKWFNVCFLGFTHLFFVWALFRYPWSQNVGLVILSIPLLGGMAAVGVSAGAHRLWTHRSYKAKLPLRIIWMLCYCIAGINPIHDWVRDHRVHHKFTDTDADPHSSKRGLFFSHIGWLLVKKHPDVSGKGKLIDMSDILEDPVVRFELRYHKPLIIVMGIIIPTCIPPLLWGQDWQWSFLACICRYVVSVNIIWSINSVSHKWGVKPFNKYISSTDSHLSSIFTVGEAWHNYHHAFPWAYKFGRLTGYQTDIGGFWIDMFAKIGWAYDLKTPSMQLLKQAADRAGDGSLTLWGAHMEIPENSDNELCSNNNKDNKKVE